MQRKFSLRYAALLVVALLGLSAPGLAATADDSSALETIKRETQDLIQALKAYTIDQRDAAMKQSKAALDRLDQRIEDLEADIDKNWDHMDQAARTKARASLKELRRQRTQVAEWYGRLKNSSVDAWEHMKEGFADAYRDLQEAWRKSEQEFGSGR